MNTKVMFSSKTDMWETPQGLFDQLDEIYHFDLDVCATQQNKKCANWLGYADGGIFTDGLNHSWYGTCWMNPPYGKEIGKWVKKAHDEARRGVTTVCLLPARTDTQWFHDYIYQNPHAETRFLKGRLKFGGCKNSAPFPSMVVVFRPVQQSNLGS